MVHHRITKSNLKVQKKINTKPYNHLHIPYLCYFDFLKQGEYAYETLELLKV